MACNWKSNNVLSSTKYLLFGSTAISPSFVIHSGSSAPSINIVNVLSSIARELSVALRTNFDSVSRSTSNGVPTIYNLQF